MSNCRSVLNLDLKEQKSRPKCLESDGNNIASIASRYALATLYFALKC